MTDESVPKGLRTAAGWSWRLLVVAAVIAVVIWLVIVFKIVVIPFLIAVLLSALLIPFSQFLQRHRWPKWIAVLVSMLAAVVLVGGLVTLVVFQVRGGWNGVVAQTETALDGVEGWLAGPPLNISVSDLSTIIADWWSKFSQNTDIWSGVLSAGTTVTHIGAGVLLCLFATLFLLIDGGRIWKWVLGVFPVRVRARAQDAASAGWTTLTAFARVQIFVAAVDAVGIGLGAWILGLFFPGGFPLVIPIAIVVFLGSFIPIVGALVTGALTVIVALVYFGWVPAIIMLAIVILVHETEAHVLQPIVMGTAVRVHALAVVFAVAAGTLIAGIPGALFAVPLVAVLASIVRHLAASRAQVALAPVGEDGADAEGGAR